MECDGHDLMVLGGASRSGKLMMDCVYYVLVRLYDNEVRELKGTIYASLHCRRRCSNLVSRSTFRQCGKTSSACVLQEITPNNPVPYHTMVSRTRQQLSTVDASHLHCVGSCRSMYVCKVENTFTSDDKLHCNASVPTTSSPFLQIGSVRGENIRYSRFTTSAMHE